MKPISEHRRLSVSNATITPSSLSPLTSQSLLKTLAVLKGHANVVNDLSWSPDGKYIATASDDETVFVWDVEGLGRRYIEASEPAGAYGIAKKSNVSTASLADSISRSAVINSNAHVEAVAWSGDGSMLAIAGGYDGSVMLWSSYTKKIVAILKGHSRAVNCLSWSLDSKQLASSSRECLVWDVGQRAVAATLRGNDVDVKAVAFSPDGLHLASGGDDHKTRVWSILAEELRADFGGIYSVTGVAWSPDGGKLASVDATSSVLLWDVKGKKLIHTLKGENIRCKPTKLAFSPDGRVLAVPRGERVRLLDVAGWTRGAELQGHAGMVTAVAFSPDGGLVATASEDGTARVWGAGRGGE